MNTKVYTLMQADRVTQNKNVEGKMSTKMVWAKDQARVVDSGFKLSNELVENHNANYEVSGSFYLLDLDSTKAYRKAADAKRKEMKADPIKWDDLPSQDK